MSKSSRRPRAASFYNPSLESLLRAFSPARRRCAHIEQLISLAADGLASDAERREIEAHQASCPSCRALMGATSAVRADLRNRPVAIIPDDLSGRLMAALSEERRREQETQLRKHRSWTTTPRLGLATGALAAAACAALIGVAVRMHEPAALHHLDTVKQPGASPIVVANNSAPQTATPVITGNGHAARKPHAMPPPSIQPHSKAVIARSTTPVQPELNAIVAPSHRIARPAAITDHTPTHAVTIAALPKTTAEHPTAPHIIHSERPAIAHSNAANTTTQIAVLPHHETPLPVAPSREPVVSAAPVHTEPVTVASVPSGTGSASSADVSVVHAGEMHNHLAGALQQLARATQQREASAASVSLAALNRRPDYTSTVSMVSSSFR